MEDEAGSIIRYGQFVHDLRLADVPSDIVHEYKRQVLDALTTVLAGSRYQGGQIPAQVAAELTEGLGTDSGTATALASGDHVLPIAAAFANTQTSIATDTAANLFFSQGLSGSCLFPALAIAERDRMSGAALLEAFIAGYEVAGRVAFSFPYPYEYELVSTDTPTEQPKGTLKRNRGGHGLRWIAFGAPTSAAKILHLEPTEAAHAIALSANVMLPPPIPGRTANMAKYGLIGGIALTGLLSAYLARAGFTGNLAILDTGDLHEAMGSHLADETALLDGLGQTWVVTEANYKRYPAGTHNQQALHALEQLKNEGAIGTDIESIEISRLIGVTNDFQTGIPRNYVETQFSLPFQCAALLSDLPQREWADAFADATLLRLAERVTLEHSPEALEEFGRATGVRSAWWFRSLVRVKSNKGLAERWSDYGTLSDEELVAKFRHYAEGLIVPDAIDRAIDMALGLDELDDVSRLCKEVTRHL